MMNDFNPSIFCGRSYFTENQRSINIPNIEKCHRYTNAYPLLTLSHMVLFIKYRNISSPD